MKTMKIKVWSREREPGLWEAGGEEVTSSLEMYYTTYTTSKRHRNRESAEQEIIEFFQQKAHTKATYQERYIKLNGE